MLDFIFVDIKHFDNNKHRELTGVGNERILDNIKSIGRLNKEVIIRIPFIKNVNDSEQNIINTARFVYDNVPKGKIELLPYHSLGNYKYDELDIGEHKNTFTTPTKEDLQKAKYIINSCNVDTIAYK